MYLELAGKHMLTYVQTVPIRGPDKKIIYPRNEV